MPNTLIHVMSSRLVTTFVELGSGVGVNESFEYRWMSRLSVETFGCVRVMSASVRRPAPIRARRGACDLPTGHIGISSTTDEARRRAHRDAPDSQPIEPSPDPPSVNAPGVTCGA